MKPIVINITNLVGTIVVIGDNTTELKDKITQALLQFLNQALESQELDLDKPLKQSVNPEDLNQDSQ